MNEQTQMTPPAKMLKEQADKIKSSINIEQIYKDKASEIIDEQLHNLANSRAEREPIPSIVGMALDPTNLTVTTSIGEVSIRKMVAIDLTIFKLTDSPFYKLMMGDVQEDSNDADKMFKKLFPDEELLYSVVYQFTHSAKEIYGLVKKGKDVYHDKIIEDMLQKEYTPQDLIDLVGSILNYIGIVNKAKVEFESKEVDEDKKKQS